MTQTTHTPGPWAAKFYAPGDCYIITYGGGDNWLADVWTDGEPVKATADARLIAAAPDLLAALEALHACHRAFSGNDNWTMLDDEARALAENAIAKAKGQ